MRLKINNSVIVIIIIIIINNAQAIKISKRFKTKKRL